MSAVVELEWTFSPPDYFEEPIKISRHDYAMTIANGKVQAKIDCGVYDADPSMRRRLDDGLNDRFLGVQLLTHRTYESDRQGPACKAPGATRKLVIDPSRPHRIHHTRPPGLGESHGQDRRAKTRACSVWGRSSI
jgi:hypothetical protein